MSTLPAPALQKFCEKFGVSSPFHTDRIRAGRNSEVLLLSNREGKWILKHYYRHAGDRRDRLSTEFAFLQFLQDSGVPGVPQPRGADHALGWGLYSFLPGSRPTVIASAHISQAAAFVREINRYRRSGAAACLPQASDACASWQDHLQLTDSRLEQLLAVTPALPLEFEALAFIRTQLLAHWLELKSKLLSEMAQGDPAGVLTSDSQIISPSDFGFHNTLEDEGRLYFVDFEYAGWDDPVKLLCDFACQPELAVSARQGRQFMEELLLLDLPDSDGIRRRVRLFLPIHRVKWCCILLNELKSEDRKRRSHAGIQPDGLLAAQLVKAKQYFATHLAATH